MSLNISPSPEAIRSTHRAGAPKGGQAMNRAHVLVVDDEADLLELVQYNLAQAGYDVTCVGSGEEALAAVGGHDVRRRRLFARAERQPKLTPS